MARRRFFVPKHAIQNDIAYLPPDQTHHLRDVLRIGAGEIVEIFDGEGSGYTGIVDFNDSGVTVHSLQRIFSPQSRVPLILAAALIKPSKFEWILQKSTELGVHEIIPMITRRCNLRISQDRIKLKFERWSRIVNEASRQCGRYTAPRIQESMSYEDILCRKKLDGFSKFLFYENIGVLWQPDILKPLPKGIVIFIGPEGGWEDGEIEQAARAGIHISSLGPWTLRAETAAVAAVSIVQYHINRNNVKQAN